MSSSEIRLLTLGNLSAPTMDVSCEQGIIHSRAVTQGPASEEWDHHRSTIKRMYLDEGKPLKEVMSIMTKEYNLRGSTKMFKYRIRKWGFDKKNKEHEMAAILRKKKERDDVGKVTSFRIRGRPVDIEEVFRYYKKKGKGFEPPAPDASTPSDISCWTPPPSRPASPGKSRYISSSSRKTRLDWQSVQDLQRNADVDDLEMILNHSQADGAGPLELWDFLSPPQPSLTIARSISPPQVLLLPEKLFANINSYFQRCLRDGTWILDDNGQLISGRGNLSVQKNPGDIVAQSSNAAGLFKKGSHVEGRQAISKVFALIQTLLTDELPTTFECILTSLLYLTKAGLHDIASMLRHYIGQMAARVLPSYHPWCQVCCIIGLPSAHDFQLLLGQSFNCLVGTLECELGRFQPRVIASRVEFIHSLHTPNDVPGAERHLRKLLSECVAFCGPSDWRSQYIMVSLGWALNHQGKYAEAEAVGNYAIQCAPDSDDSTTVIRRSELIGDSQYRQGKLRVAEGNIRETIEVIVKTRGRADPWGIENMIRLEGWLRDWGRDDEAAQLKAEVLDLLGPDNLTESW